MRMKIVMIAMGLAEGTTAFAVFAMAWATL